MTVDWKVIVVFDPDHTGHDFAYTVGLHDHGRPELFLWARPTDGDDPGVDWVLSGYDLAHRLNELGSQLVDGTLAPGASIDVEYDGGATTATMILRQPVAAHDGDLEAFQTAPDATVIEIRWSLHQRPIGPRRELTPDELDTARARLAAFFGEDGAASVAFPASARFGPHTPLVHALRLQTRSLDDHRAERLLAAIMLAHLPESELGPIAQAARAAGLVDEVEDAFADATVDARVLADRVFADEPELARQVTNLFASIFSVAYGTELVRHELPGPPPACSEVMWALLDPDGARTRRYVDHVRAADPALGHIFDDPDLVRLASIIQGLDEETVGNLAGLWVQAAARGHGSGIWLMALLFDPTIPHETQWFAGVALATAGNIALDVPVPGELGLAFVKTVRHVIDEVRAVSPLRRAS
jgi:hypothetical protein